MADGTGAGTGTPGGDCVSEIAERLAEARIQSGYSLREAGERSGVPQREIGRFEQGCITPHPLDLRCLCVLYGCSVEWMTGRI